MPYDEIDVTILADGTIRSDNGKISAPNHSNAGEFFRHLGELTGGKVQRTKRQPTHVHLHDKIVERE